MMQNLLNVWTKDFYFGYLGYFYNAGLLCYGKASVNQF